MNHNDHRMLMGWLGIAVILLLPACTAFPSPASIAEITPTAEPTATNTPIPSPTPEPVEPTPVNFRVSDVDGMPQIFIPAGEFVIGCSGSDCTINAGPGPWPDNLEHQVFLDGYWIDQHEVTNAQYLKCVDAGACRPSNQNNLTPDGLAYFSDSSFDNYPVINVSWYMARDYCTWAGRRMLTEGEWEKAARGTDGRKYPWGDDKQFDLYANFCDKYCPPAKKGDIANPNFEDGYSGTAPVGSYPKGASPYGLMDMAGNVWEWTSTAAEPYPYDANDGREALYDIEDGAKWPERILKGGPWNGGYAYLRSSFRYRAVAIYWNNNMGIRCAASP